MSTACSHPGTAAGVGRQSWVRVGSRVQVSDGLSGTNAKADLCAAALRVRDALSCLRVQAPGVRSQWTRAFAMTTSGNGVPSGSRGDSRSIST